MKQLSEAILRQGYIMIPKALIKEQAQYRKTDDLAAFLKIILRVNYSEQKFIIHGRQIICQRGESLISYRHWSEILGWTRPRTTRFIQRLQEEGTLKIIPHDSKLLHLRIENYDWWMGQVKLTSNNMATKTLEDFNLFWDKYHQITESNKKSVARARREWLKLTPKEQELAYNRIEEFYYHINDLRFVPLAATYLKDKSFLDEYID